MAIPNSSMTPFDGEHASAVREWIEMAARAAISRHAMHDIEQQVYDLAKRYFGHAARSIESINRLADCIHEALDDLEEREMKNGLPPEQ